MDLLNTPITVTSFLNLYLTPKLKLCLPLLSATLKWTVMSRKHRAKEAVYFMGGQKEEEDRKRQRERGRGHTYPSKLYPWVTYFHQLVLLP